MTASQNAKIVELQEYLTRIAYNLHINYYPSQSPDDLLQVMNLYILERAAGDPEFLNQTKGYVTKSAAWAARNWCSPERKGANHGNDRVAYSLDQDRADGIDPAETLAAETLAADSPDTDLSIAVRQALSSLGEMTIQIAEMMVSGFKIKEIASELNITRQTVRNHKIKIKAALAPVMG